MGKPQAAEKDLKQWTAEVYRTQTERQGHFQTLSGLDVMPLYIEHSSKREFPGVFPYTRGIQPSMYRGRLWTMRQFAGFGTPEDTNKRFHYLLSNGQTGLSTAFDMPTLMGYDADHPRAEGEVGREGVSVSTIDDMERLFSGIELDKVTTSMTINCTAAPVLAMYFAIARRRKIDLNKVGGTIQNDILKEFIAQKEWISPPEPSVRIVADVIEYCADHAKKFNPVSVSGYHIREAGATAVQELAFTLYDGLTYVEACLKRGRDVDSFVGQLSFFFDVHNDFFEEIAKLRAARRMWAKLMRERYGAKHEKSLKLRMHCQTAGVSLTAQQPLNNIVRVSLQALAAVLGGTQSLHTNSMDETYALPTEEAVKVALRTQQLIAEESGVTNTIDPLGGSYFVEQLTDEIERKAFEYIDRLDKMGGMIKAISSGFPQKEIADAAFKHQEQIDNGELGIVGVNRYCEKIAGNSIPTLKIDSQIEEKQRLRTKEFKGNRSEADITHWLAQLAAVCRSPANLMPTLIDAVDAGVTVGEVADIYRTEFGLYSDPGHF